MLGSRHCQEVLTALVGAVFVFLMIFASATAQEKTWSMPQATTPLTFSKDFCNWCGCCTETQQGLKMRELRNTLVPDQPGKTVIIMNKSYADLVERLMERNDSASLSMTLKQMHTNEIGARVDFCNWCKCCVETDNGLDVKVPDMVDPKGMERFILIPE